MEILEEAYCDMVDFYRSRGLGAVFPALFSFRVHEAAKELKAEVKAFELTFPRSGIKISGADEGHL